MTNETITNETITNAPSVEDFLVAVSLIESGQYDLIQLPRDMRKSYEYFLAVSSAAEEEKAEDAFDQWCKEDTGEKPGYNCWVAPTEIPARSIASEIAAMEAAEDRAAERAAWNV